MRPLAITALAILATGYLSGTATAQGLYRDGAMALEGVLQFEVADEGFDRVSPTVTSEWLAQYTFAPGLNLVAGAVVEPVVEPDGPQWLASEGLYLGEIYLEYSLAEAGAVRIGKFGPGFGTGWDVTPGIVGTRLAEAYELAEMVGAELALELDPALGALPFTTTVSLAAFMQDRSILSQSLLHDRGRIALSDGGAANTTRPESFSAAVDLFWNGETSVTQLHLAARDLAPGTGGAGHERAWTIGFVSEFELAADVVLAVNVERFARFDARPGDESADGWIAGLAYGTGAWTLSANGSTYSSAATDGAAASLWEIAIEHALPGAWNLGVSLSQLRENAIAQDHAIRMAFARSFALTL